MIGKQTIESVAVRVWTLSMCAGRLDPTGEVVDCREVLTPKPTAPVVAKPGSLRSRPDMFACLLALLALISCSSGGGELDGAGPAGTGGQWSDPLTWGGQTPPESGDSVFIGAGQTIVLDTDTAALDCLRIEGTLVADSSLNVGVTANCIEVMPGGTLQIGSEIEPYDRRATITLTGPRGLHQARAEDNALDNDGVQRAIRVMDGGSLKLFGATPELLRSKLSAHAYAGATTLVLTDPVDWQAGDKLAVSLTDFFGVGETEIVTLAANSAGNVVNTTTGLQTFRWGLLQYPVDLAVSGSAVSLSPGTFTPASASTPTVLDERAEVVNLTRRIVIQGADDGDWSNEGFGAHVMVMGLQSTAQVRGVEFRRCGQRRALGRYPFHWHMLSFTHADGAGQGGGSFLGSVDPADHFLQDSAVWESENRAVTIHGTCGVNVSNVYAVDIKGHAFFMEDGSESANEISGCVAMKVRDPDSTNRMKAHDRFASGFWLTNPDNTITHNSASDCDGRGLWNSFADHCFGHSRNAAVEPRFIVIRQFDDNTGHSNGQQGLMTDMVVVDEAGNTLTARYLSRFTSGQEHEFTMRRNITWKNNGGGYTNRVMAAQYEDWTAADNNGKDFEGSTLGGSSPTGATMSGTLLIGSSLNKATPFTDPARIGIASYHHALNFPDITAINYQYSPPVMSFTGAYVHGGGVFDGSDLYTLGVSLGLARCPGWRLINAHPGFLTPPPYFDGFPLQINSGANNGYRHWTVAGAIWDPHGYWGPAGNYLVHDSLFYTLGLASYVPISPAGINAVSTPDKFFGIRNIVADNEVTYDSSLRPMRLARLNTSNFEVADHTVGDPNVAIFFSGKTFFAAAHGGRYRLTMPGTPLPTSSLSIVIGNAYLSTDNFLIGLPWPGTVPVAGRLESGSNVNVSTGVAEGRMRVFSNTGNSVGDVLADATGTTIWQDNANNCVWVQHVGGLAFPISGDPLSHTNLRRDQILRLYPQ